MGQFLQGRPTTVHKRHGLGQHNIDIFDRTTAENGVEFRFVKGYVKIPRNFVGDHEAGIVPGIFIIIARIPESDNQSKSIRGHSVDGLFFFFRFGFGFSGLPFGTFFTFLEPFFLLFGNFFFLDLRAEYGDDRIIDIGHNFYIVTQRHIL